MRKLSNINRRFLINMLLYIQTLFQTLLNIISVREPKVILENVGEFMVCLKQT